MNKTDEEIRNDWKYLDEHNVELACQYLRSHETDILKYIADIVSSLCNIDKSAILCMKNKELKYVHARWLLWYVYRYMTAESYKGMAVNSMWSTADASAIQYGVTKMSDMIEREALWNRRWNIIKKILDIRNDNMEKIDNTIVIVVPRDIKDKINIKIKDK